MSGFCATPLWDTNLTWHSENPDLTACFHKTALVYLPAALFLLLLPLELWLQSKAPKLKISWTLVNILKLVVACLLVLVNLVGLLLVVTGEEDSVTANLVASIVRLVTDGALILCLVRNKRSGRVTSPVTFTFTALVFLTSCFTLASVLRFSNTDGQVLTQTYYSWECC